MGNGDPPKRKVAKRKILSKFVLMNSLQSHHTDQSRRYTALFGGVSSLVGFKQISHHISAKVIKDKENSVQICSHGFVEKSLLGALADSSIATLWGIFNLVALVC